MQQLQQRSAGATHESARAPHPLLDRAYMDRQVLLLMLHEWSACDADALAFVLLDRAMRLDLLPAYRARQALLVVDDRARVPGTTSTAAAASSSSASPRLCSDDEHVAAAIEHNPDPDADNADNNDDDDDDADSPHDAYVTRARLRIQPYAASSTHTTTGPIADDALLRRLATRRSCLFSHVRLLLPGLSPHHALSLSASSFASSSSITLNHLRIFVQRVAARLRGALTCSFQRAFARFDQVDALAAHLSSSSALRTLSLVGQARNGRAHLSLSAPGLVRLLRSPSLTALNISVHSFDSIAICRLLACVPRLTCFRISADFAAQRMYGDLDAVPVMFRALSASRDLRILDVGGFDIGQTGFEALTAMLAQLPRLTSLRISCNDLTSSNAASLLRALSHLVAMHKLVELRLPSNHLDDLRSHPLFSLPGAARRLLVLDLSGNRLRADASVHLMQSLAVSAPHLRVLNLSSRSVHENMIEARGCVALARAIRGRTDTGTCIDVSSTPGCSSGLVHLRVIDLQFNMVGGEGCAALAHALECLPHLRVLRLGWNDMLSAGCEALSRGLVHTHSLVLLDLTSNRVLEPGAGALASTLGAGRLPMLRVLRLAGNLIRDAGCRMLAAAFRQPRDPDGALRDRDHSAASAPLAPHPTLSYMPSCATPQLRVLDLGANEISSDGCRELAHSLRALPLLNELELGANAIADDGCSALSRVLCEQCVSHLRILSLSWNKVTDEGCGEIVRSVSQKSKELRAPLVIDLRGNFRVSKPAIRRGALVRVLVDR